MSKTATGLFGLVTLACGIVSCGPGPMPAPTLVPTATTAPTSLPSPTPTLIPVPSPDELSRQYDEEVRPLAESLWAAQQAPADVRLPQVTDWRVALVPLSGRLFYVQALLFPEWALGTADSAIKVYVVYTYSRGKDLGWLPLTPDTQEVVAQVRLVAEVEEGFYVVEQTEGTGGTGSSSFRELVEEAVQAPGALGIRGEEVENVLEVILGYVTGVDWDDALDLPRRLGLLQWALSSENWADRRQAAAALGSVPGLFWAEEDENAQVRKAAVRALIQTAEDENVLVREAAVSALGNIGAQEGVIPALMRALGDEDKGVRYLATVALLQIADLALLFPDSVPELEEAVPALIHALGDEDRNVREGAARALVAITSQDFGEDAAAWQQWWEGQQ